VFLPTEYCPVLLIGLPQAATELHKLGNQAPTALVGWTNSFTYKNFGLNFLIDGRFGGKFYSGTNLNLQRSGSAAMTAPNGNRSPLIVDGVVGANGAYTKNTVETTQQLYWSQVTQTSGNFGITEANMYDATNIRLRNVSLSYNFPSSILKNSIIQRAKVSFTANNVWMIKSYANGIDPESVFAVNSNATGLLSESNELCSCGKKGCLEVEASLTAAIKNVQQALNDGEKSSLGAEQYSNLLAQGDALLENALNGDQLAVASLGKIGYMLGKGVATLIHILNPEVIVISGRGAKAGSILMPQIQTAVNEFCIPRLASTTQIQISDTNKQAQSIGTAAFIIENTLQTLIKAN